MPSLSISDMLYMDQKGTDWLVVVLFRDMNPNSWSTVNSFVEFQLDKKKKAKKKKVQYNACWDGEVQNTRPVMSYGVGQKEKEHSNLEREEKFWTVLRKTGP